MTIDGPYLSQLFLLGLLTIIGWLLRARLTEIMEKLDELARGETKTRERLIRIETKLGVEHVEVNNH